MQAFTIAAAGIGVGILTIPIIASVAEDALSAVPIALREASYGLGANRWQSTFKVVFPAGDLRHHRRPDPRRVASDR
jgi:phosphate transport system permease protein